MSSTRPRSDDWKRECLANAIQTNSEALVRDVLFSTSELPDLLVQDDCLSEDECYNLRIVPQEPDQIRLLICNIIGKDYIVLKTFVQHLYDIGYQYIAEKINYAFTENIKGAVVSRKRCTFTKLKDNVDIKRVCDRLWSDQAISVVLYRQIAHCTNPAGTQDELWDCLFNELNQLLPDQREGAYTQLRNVLFKEHYSHIASEFDSKFMDRILKDKEPEKSWNYEGDKTACFQNITEYRYTDARVPKQSEDHLRERFKNDDFTARRLQELLPVSNERRFKRIRHAVYVLVLSVGFTFYLNIEIILLFNRIK